MRWAIAKLRRWSRKLEKLTQQLRDDIPVPREEFAQLQLSNLALQAVLDHYEFDTVLDIGGGAGEHATHLAAAGKTVTAIDYGRSVYFKNNHSSVETLIGDFNTYSFDMPFDCVWCSHVLEHQLDAHLFLTRVHQCLKEGGVLAITVPPAKEQMVGGHVSLWNGGLLLYRLVLAGFDCSEASVLSYGYNISVLLRKRSVGVLEQLDFDAGDLRRIRPYLPASIPFSPTDTDDLFDGRIDSLNWPQ